MAEKGSNLIFLAGGLAHIAYKVEYIFISHMKIIDMTSTGAASSPNVSSNNYSSATKIVIPNKNVSEVVVHHIYLS